MSYKQEVGIAGFQQVAGKNEINFGKSAARLCLTVILSISMFAASVAMADQGGKKTKGERLGHYTLEDESMLGRYGDVNDEWVAPVKSQVSHSQMTESAKRKMHKKDNRLGSYSLQDDAMLGHYGDKNDE